ASIELVSHGQSGALTRRSADTLGRSGQHAAASRIRAPTPVRLSPSQGESPMGMCGSSLTRDRPEEVRLTWTEVDRAVSPALPATPDVAVSLLAATPRMRVLQRKSTSFRSV